MLSRVWLFVTLWECSLPFFHVHGIFFQARTLEWVAISSSREFNILSCNCSCNHNSLKAGTVLFIIMSIINACLPNALLILDTCTESPLSKITTAATANDCKHFRKHSRCSRLYFPPNSCSNISGITCCFGSWPLPVYKWCQFPLLVNLQGLQTIWGKWCHVTSEARS